MQEINFSLPVADIDRHSVYYKHPSNLLTDLKKLGETNSLLRMNKSFLRKDVLNRMYEIYTLKCCLSKDDSNELLKELKEANVRVLGN